MDTIRCDVQSDLSLEGIRWVFKSEKTLWKAEHNRGISNGITYILCIIYIMYIALKELEV